MYKYTVHEYKCTVQYLIDVSSAPNLLIMSSKQPHRENEFRTSFAKALADALDQDFSAQSDAEIVHETYRELCHDDPRNWTARGCKLLAKELLKGETYALSTRLIDGIEQLLHRYEKSEPVSSTSSKTEQPTESSLVKEQEEGTAASIAQLAYTIHIQIPIECLVLMKNKKLSKATYMLGSFQSQRLQKSCGSDDHVSNLITSNVEPRLEETETCSLQEVWAVESDPSDFAFESGYDYNSEIKELDMWAKGLIDPISLSKAVNMTESQCHQAIHHLLQKCSYSTHLSSLPVAAWKSSWQHWRQLVFVLLVESEASSLSNAHMDSLHVLNIVRDAALDHPGEVLENYIHLIQALLQVQSAQEESKTDKATCPAAWLGLGALASLCNNDALWKAPYLQLLQRSVVESCDDICLVTELSVQNTTGSNDEKLRTLLWTAVSFMNIATQQARPHECRNVSASSAQSFLQAGLFSKWMLLWQESKTNSVNGYVELIERSLLDLCACSPNLLGKYAWRYPSFAATVTNSPSDCGGLLSRLQWNLLGISLSSGTSTGLQWKSKSKLNALTHPTISSCQKEAWAAFQLLIQHSREQMEDWKTELEWVHAASTQHAKSSHPGNDLSTSTAIPDFVSFVDAFESIGLLRSLFITELAPVADGKSRMQSLSAVLSPLHDILKTWPIPDQALPKDKDDDKPHVTDESEQRKAIGLIGEQVRQLRRRLKILSTMLLDPSLSSATASSKSD